MPERLDKALVVKRKQGGFDMLRDLRDKAFEAAITQIRHITTASSNGSMAHTAQAAPQTLVVPP